MSSVVYFDCEGVPVRVKDRLSTAFDVPGGRPFRSTPKPGSFDTEISKSAFDAMVEKHTTSSATKETKKQVTPIQGRSATAEDYKRLAGWNISLGPLKMAEPKQSKQMGKQGGSPSNATDSSSGPRRPR